MLDIKQILSLVFFVLSFNLQAQEEDQDISSLEKTITEIASKVERVINDNWFLVKSDSGFTLYYCKTCQDAFLEWQSNRENVYYGKLKQNDSFMSANENFKAETDAVYGLLYSDTLNRRDFFITKGPDSVYYFTTMSQIRRFYKVEETIKLPKNEVLKIEVHFQPKWTSQKYDAVLANNEMLKKEILKKPLGKSNKYIFSDYRFWIPREKLWKDRLNDFDSYFERLPYHSCWYNYSVFIVPDKPFFFADGILCFDADDNPYSFSEKERRQTILSVAYVLGINDYHFVN